MRRTATIALLCCLLLVTTPGVAGATTTAPAGWVKVGTAVSGYNQMDFVSSTVGFRWAGGSLFRSTNGGGTWAKVGGMPLYAQEVDFVNANTGYAAGMQTDWATDTTTMHFYVTTDGGKSWSEKSTVPPARRYSAMKAIGSKIWLAGESETIVHSPDGGATWETQHSNESAKSNRFEAMTFLNESTGWATGAQFSPAYRGLVCRTTDGGKTWTRVTLGVGTKLNSVDFYDAKSGWVAGYEANKVYRTTNGGATWKACVVKDFKGTPWSMFFATRLKGWMSTSNGLYQTKDGGLTWVQYLSGKQCSAIASYGRAKAWVFAAPMTGTKSQLYRWTK